MAFYKTKHDENIYKQCRVKLGISQKELAAKVGVGASAVSKWESGAANPDTALLPVLAEIFGVSAGYLLRQEKSELLSQAMETVIEYPVIGSVRAGMGGNVVSEETGDTRLVAASAVHGRADDYFVLRVRGDSMYPEVLDGDCVLVRKTPSVESGSMAVVLYDGDCATVKWVRYVEGEDWVDLVPNNPTFPPARISGADLENCKILGEVVDIMRTPKKRNW